MNHKEENGFSYIEVLIALVILLVGILALLSSMAAAVLTSHGQGIQLEALQIATTTVESIMSVKATDPERLGWDAVGNVGANIDPETGDPQGIFVVGRTPVLSSSGPDEVFGTADDEGAAIPGYERTIVITDICDPDRPSYNCPTPGPARVRFRQVEVTIFYTVGQSARQERITTVLSDYAVTE